MAIGGHRPGASANQEFSLLPVAHEQAQVHIAIGYAKMKNRLQTFACTSSIGPGATNMITGAATATVQSFTRSTAARGHFRPAQRRTRAQAAGVRTLADTSVNDSFKPVSRYWDRISRPEQLLTSAPEADARPDQSSGDRCRHPGPAPDVQTEAFDFPAEFFGKTHLAHRSQRADRALLQQAANGFAPAVGRCCGRR